MNNVNWTKVGEWLNSPSGQAAIGAAGAGVSAYANSRANRANTARLAENSRTQAAQFAAEMAMRFGQNSIDNRSNAAVNAANASPLGANEDFAAKQAARRFIFQRLRNPSVIATDPEVAAAMPQMTSAFSIPEGGIPEEVYAALSPEATAGAIAQRQKHITNIDPYAPGIDFEGMGFDSSFGSGLQDETDAYQYDALGRVEEEKSRSQQQMEAALAGQTGIATAAAPQKKKSIWAKLGKVAKIAVPIVLAATGVGAPAAAAIMAATYAADAKANGSTWKGAAGQGLVGGVAGAAGAGALGAAGGGAAAAGGRAAAGSVAKQAAIAAGTNAVNSWSQRQQQQQQNQAAIDAQRIAAGLRRQQFRTG